MSTTSPASAYDSADRLLSFQRGLLAGGGGSVAQHLSLPGVDYQRSYNLDGLGNWVDDGWSGSAPAVSFSHDCAPDSQSRTTNDLNQIASVNGSSLSYDVKGNLLGYGDLIFTYDAFNRLIGVSGTGPDGSSVDQLIAYDARNRRVYKGTTDFSDYSEFYFDGPQVIGETGPNGLEREYVWGQYVDELVQQREYQNPPNGGTYEDLYPLSDLLYRTVALARQSPCGSSSAGPGGMGASSGGPAIPFAEVYDTDVYGRTRAYNSPGPDGRWFTDDDVRTFDPLCRYLFTGREYDSDTGLYYCRSRYYHPDLGRFLTRDSIGYAGGMNLYGYTHGNPLRAGDPMGLGPEPNWKANPIFPGDRQAGHLSHAQAMEGEAAERARWFESHTPFVAHGDRDVRDTHSEYWRQHLYWQGEMNKWHSYAEKMTPQVSAFDQLAIRWLGEEPNMGGRMLPVLGYFRTAVRRWDEVFYGRGSTSDRAWSAVYGSGDVVLTAVDLLGAISAVRALRGAIGGVAGNASRLIHLTDEAGEAGIKATGILRGKRGIFAIPAEVAGESTAMKVARSGLRPSRVAKFVEIPGAVSNLFRRPTPVGPYSLIKYLGGVRFAPPGTIDMATGAFTRGAAVFGPHALIYGLDVFIHQTAKAAYAYIQDLRRGG